MTQDERWLQQWQTVMDFMEANKRRPSKFVDEERGMRNWWKHQQKLLNAGELKSERIELSPNGPVVALNVPAGQWHTVKALESGSVILECKEGAYEPQREEDILQM